MEYQLRNRSGYSLATHYFVYPFIIVITFLLVTIVNVRVLRGAVYDTHRQDLEVITRIARNTLPVAALTDSAVAQRFCETVVAGTTIRITLIAPDGTVLGDSHADPSLMENHSFRPEIRRSLAGELGSSTRYSETLDYDLIYTALPLIDPGNRSVRGVIRGSLIVDSVEGRLSALYRNLIAPGVILLLLALLAAIILSRSIRRPLGNLYRAALAYAEGDLERSITPEGPRELTKLGSTLHAMARQLQRRIKELDEQRRETVEVLNTIQEPLLLLDEWTRVQRANDAALRFFGREIDEVRERLVLDLFRNSELDAFVHHVQESDGVTETEITTYDDPRRRLRLWAVHLTTETSLLRNRILMLIRDVTPEYRMEQIRKDFVANVSHELKTPLTLIHGAIETLADISPEQTTERRRFEEMIATHTDRMSGIVEDLLNLARIEQAEEHVVAAEATDITALLNETVWRIVERPADIAADIDLSVPPDLRWPVHAQLIELAITNIVDNAIQHSGSDGAISIIATAGDVLEIAIRDNGNGIPPQELDRIFERFYRVDRGRSRARGGTGLGLSIVRHIARVHGGTVTAESVLGRGSTFTITIPGEK